MEPNANNRYLEVFERVLFILGDFPAPSQTFITNELVEMQTRGIPIHVLADTEIARDDLNPWLQRISEKAIYMESPSKIGLAAFRSLRKPLFVAGTMRWALGLPHRTARHRARFILALACALSVAPRVRRGGYRYLHAHFAGFQTEVAMCLSRILRIPYGVTWHAYGIWRDNNVLAQKIGGARVVLTCTDYNALHLREVAPSSADRIHRLYHGIDLTNVPEISPPQEGRDREWLAVGRLIPKKGFTYLLDAARQLADREVPFHVTIIGDGPDRDKLRRKIERLALGDHVFLAGTIPNPQVWEMLRSARGLIAPSVRDTDGDIDGIPNVLLEAMATGRAVIGTDISGLPEIVRNHETGILVAPGDATALASSIEKLSRDKELAMKLGRGGRSLVEREFDLSVNVNRQLDLISDALDV